MKELAKRFWIEEEGLGTVELIILIGVLVGVAVIFREQIRQFVRSLIGKDLVASDDFDNTDVFVGVASDAGETVADAALDVSAAS